MLGPAQQDEHDLWLRHWSYVYKTGLGKMNKYCQFKTANKLNPELLRNGLERRTSNRPSQWCQMKLQVNCNWCCFKSKTL